MSEIDPKLSRLYRVGSTEGPPAALDAAIVAAARKQAAKPQLGERSQRDRRSQRQGRSLWSRWLVPAGAIATLVLGVSLALLVEREQPATNADTAIRQISPRPQSPPAPATESAKAKAADSAAPAAAAKKEAPTAAAQVPAPAPTAPAPVSASPARAPASDLPAQAPLLRRAEPASSAAEAFPAESRAKASAPTTAPKAVAPEVPAQEAAKESNTASDAAAGRLGAAAPAAPAAAAKPAPMRQQAIRRSPEAWLDEISRLKREGREKEAAEQLAEFRKAYPAYAVPESLQNLQ